MSHRLISTSQGTSQDTLTLAECQCSSNLTINHLPDEVLLEIFDSFKVLIDSGYWCTKFLHFILTHVCRRWRTIIFASTSRLGLHITVGPGRPRHLRTILSGPLPIFIGYNVKDFTVTKSSLWRLRSALKKHDRVRGISFKGSSAWFDEFFSATNCTFPLLESIVLHSRYGQDIPETFLGGPDLSNLHLQCLNLHNFSFKSISRLLLSASTLIDLDLEISASERITLPETSLPACLQGMPLLCRLNLRIPSSTPLEYLSSPLPPQTTLKDSIVPLTKLTLFHYSGDIELLDAIVAGLSAPALESANMKLGGTSLSPIVHVPRFIDEIKEHRRTAKVSFGWICSLSLSQPSWLQFECTPEPEGYPESIMQMSGALSPKLISVEELHIFLSIEAIEHGISWHKFYQHFPNVKVIRTKNTAPSGLAGTLLQDLEKHVDDLTCFPALEEIEVGHYQLRWHESRSESELAVFDPFISARQRIGRPVKVYAGPVLG